MMPSLARTFRYLALGIVLLAFRVQADDVHDCIAINDDAARLACYDHALGRSVAAAAAKSPNAEFGMSSAIKRKQEPAVEKVPDTITARVTSARKNADGTFNLAMDNQQTWRTLESDWSIDFAPADEVVIKRGLTGAYYLHKSNSNRSLRARRVE